MGPLVSLNMRPKPVGPVRAAIAAVVTSLVLVVASRASAGEDVIRETVHVELPAGAADVDVYRPLSATPTPMVIVVHGFSRHRHHMSGWGRHLAMEGMVAVVPDLPTWSDHARNGRFLSELRARLLGDEALTRHVDPARVGLLGFSAGGLSSLLSAADAPGVTIWVGLDPVDRDGLGVRAATRVRSRAVVLTAGPSECNARGNARDLVAALPGREHFGIAGAVHVDAEWPTSWLAELVCGRSTNDKRIEFQVRATAVLKEAFAMPATDDERQTPAKR